MQCQAKPAGSSEADAPRRTRAFGRSELIPRRPAIRIQPADVRARCREPPGGRFYIVPSLLSFGDLREGYDSPARRGTGFREAGTLAATIPVVRSGGRLLLSLEIECGEKCVVGSALSSLEGLAGCGAWVCAGRPALPGAPCPAEISRPATRDQERMSVPEVVLRVSRSVGASSPAWGPGSIPVQSRRWGCPTGDTSVSPGSTRGGHGGGSCREEGERDDCQQTGSTRQIEPASTRGSSLHPLIPSLTVSFLLDRKSTRLNSSH